MAEDLWRFFRNSFFHLPSLRLSSFPDLYHPFFLTHLLIFFLSFFFYEFDSFWNFLFFVSLRIYPIFFFSSCFSPRYYPPLIFIFRCDLWKHESEDEFPNRVLCIISRISLILFPSSSSFPFPLFLLLLLPFILNPLNFKTHDEFVNLPFLVSLRICLFLSTSFSPSLSSSYFSVATFLEHCVIHFYK